MSGSPGAGAARPASLTALLPAVVSGLRVARSVPLAPRAGDADAPPARRAAGLLASGAVADDPDAMLAQRWQEQYLLRLLDDLEPRLLRARPATVVVGTSRFLQTCTLQTRTESVVFVDVRETAFLQALAARIHRIVRASADSATIGPVPGLHFQSAGLLSTLALGALCEAHGDTRAPDACLGPVLGYLTAAMGDAVFSLNRLAGLSRLKPGEVHPDRFPDANAVLPALLLAHELAHLATPTVAAGPTIADAVGGATLDIWSRAARSAGTVAGQLLGAIAPRDAPVAAAVAAIEAYVGGDRDEHLQLEILADVHAVLSLVPVLDGAVPGHRVDGTGAVERWNAAVVAVALAQAAKAVGASMRLPPDARMPLGTAIAAYLLRAVAASLVLVMLDGDAQRTYGHATEYAGAGLVCLLELCTGLELAERGQIRRVGLPRADAAHLPEPATSFAEAARRFAEATERVAELAGAPPLAGNLRGTALASLLHGRVWRYGDESEGAADE